MIEDVSPLTTWQALKTDPQAQLVDVRTDAEWTFVGFADLSEIGKQMVPVSWQSLDGRPNGSFVEQLAAAGLQPGMPIYFLCRSGARSRAAALAARQGGFTQVFNVADGFEGPPDDQAHRGTVAGWKKDGLPWRQG
ncbi:rhodanese-like domain-containing protein [Ameyamaea chiangmaiensis]|uniref:Rhodanese-like domain-containing protein n=1 Tax=Ameyamaea chiangmaiensis TaxID=442969 RepID=A0A850PGZ7_9PROT|nr:rhodanese-like domain-containing protein [Ameyamaea chiangmaiensis]MBS4075986.1 rhodanese-like domain-containing protein [Ameyamaea chiangmaiensis]NVN41929.1 rhodanese-like domain-containing protein [Ameyamaea chiangmaiensis]